MTRVAPIPPAETDILCENCGYTLNGLPDSGNCPECGAPIAASTSIDARTPPAIERANDNRGAFWKTSLLVLCRPTHFFRTTTTRSRLDVARSFASNHWAIASILFGSAATVHADWYMHTMIGLRSRPWMWIVGCALVVATYIVLNWTTKLAAKLTAWEAAYRGLRLPYRAVLRAMHYHAVHYVPVALVAFVTIVGYRVFFSGAPRTAEPYLYTLCAEVIIGAAYLFNTYWIAMRNMMYANR